MLFLAALSCACSRYHGRFTDSSASDAATLLDASLQLNGDASTPPGHDSGPARRPNDAAVASPVASNPPMVDAAVTSPASSKPLTTADVDALATPDPVPDCRAPGFVPPAPHTRWLAFRGSNQSSAPASVYLVQVGDHGPSKPYEAGPNYVAELSNIGEWSDDGRYFGFVGPDPNSASLTQGSYVVDTQASSGPEKWQVPGRGHFYHWVPHRSLFALIDNDGMHFMDAADHTRNTLIAGTTKAYIRLVWSTDGRYGADASDGTLNIVDLNAADLTQLAFTTASAGATAPQWAPGGHRLIFVGAGSASNQLMLIDLDAAKPKPVALATVETTNEGAELVTRWLDADRVLVWARNSVMQIIDTQAKADAVETLGTFDDQFQFLPGNRCLVYSGACLPNGMAATCIMSLDRKVSRMPRAVFPGKNFRMITSAAGTPVLFRGGEELLVELGFEGAAYKPNYVTRPAPTPAFRFFSNNPSLSAAPEVPWVHFIAAPSEVFAGHSYFWNHATRKLVEDVAEGLSFGDLGLFSPDGRDYAATAQEVSQSPTPKWPLVILRPHPDAPTEQWQLDVFATSGFADENMAWSP
jgi:hypothetical protein